MIDPSRCLKSAKKTSSVDGFGQELTSFQPAQNRRFGEFIFCHAQEGLSETTLLLSEKHQTSRSYARYPESR